MQKRAVSGVDFENSFQVDGWVRKATSPRFKWSGKGRTIIDKIKSVNYDPEFFILDESSKMSKYDIVNTITGGKREVKKYPKEGLKGWSLYSEAFFKIASENAVKQISVDVYNKFVEDYYNHYKNTGLFDRVIEKMNEGIEGVQVIGEFIPMDELKFKVDIIRNSWKKYHRLSILIKLK
jgi:hypothetical protein